jgi:hypothetical protein
MDSRSHKQEALKDASSKEKQKTSWIAKQPPRMIKSDWLEKRRIAEQPYRILKTAWLERAWPKTTSWMCL